MIAAILLQISWAFNGHAAQLIENGCEFFLTNSLIIKTADQVSFHFKQCNKNNTCLFNNRTFSTQFFFPDREAIDERYKICQQQES